MARSRAGDPRGEAVGAGRPPLDALLALIDRGRPLAVQTHDFPDIDAVASAWALARLLGRFGISATAVYRGEIRSRSLSRLVEELRIELAPEPPAAKGLQLIVVDGSPVNDNVSLFEGELVGVIDHHCLSSEPAAPFLDLKPELASCATIIHEYWEAAGEEIPRDIATALLAGIQSDTDFLSRRASKRDFAAYAALFEAGDFEGASRIVRTVLDLRELGYVVRALGSAVTRDGVLWAWLPGACGQEVLAVLADFVLRAEEIRAAIVAERDLEGSRGSGVHLSIRSKDPRLSAFALAHRALDGIGSGGGHSHSAGGFISDATFPGEEQLRERFFALAREFSR